MAETERCADKKLSVASVVNPMHDDTLERERARLAARLHEVLVDPLALLAAQAGAFEQAAGRDDRQRAAFGLMASLARQTLQRARDLEDELGDRAVELGLEVALERLCARVMRGSAALVELSLPRRRGDLPPMAARALLRFAQDAVDRALGPAYAHHVRLRLDRAEGHIALLVADDGDPAAGAELAEAAARPVTRLGGVVARAQGAHGGLALTAELPLAPAEVLTPREREVLALLSAGLDARAIAGRLGVRPRTVTFHLANLYAKLGVAGRAEAIVVALRGVADL